MTGYVNVPAASYILDVTPGSDNETIVASFTADLSSLDGGSAVVFASGFLTPSANMDGEAFGLYAALANGTVVEFPGISQARMQVIHNSADKAAAMVDIYLWNGDKDELVVKLNDFEFRQATPFVDVPGSDSLSVIIAGPTSEDETDQVVATIPVGALANGNTYVVIANGLVAPGDYASNPDGVSTAFQLLIKDMTRESAEGSGVDFFALHGSTDAPTVDVIARGVATLVNDAAYTDMTGYVNVPAASYILDVTPGSDSTTIVASFIADLSALDGGSAVVFASGFLTPSANMDGEAFGLYAALANGTVVEFPGTSEARMQVIHNSADKAAAMVDIYLWNGDKDELVIKLDDFEFRQATPFVDVPGGDSLSVIIAGPTSEDETDQVVATIPVGGLANGNTYVVMANGLVTPGGYAANPDGISTAFELLIKDMAQESGTGDNVDFFILHGSTDAPTVDIIARGVTTLADDAAYTDMTGYLSVPAASYTIDITPGSENETIIVSYAADLSGLEGGSAVVFASGFLAPESNQNGEAFGIYAALANGTVVAFSTVTSIEGLSNETAPSTYALSQNYPNPFNPSTKIRFNLPIAETVRLKIFDIAGREVATLVDGRQDAGVFEVTFDAADFASGVYFYRLEAGSFTAIKRMMLIK